MRCDNNIRGGFSFCGVDIAELGLSYAPDKEDTYVYRPADINIHEETFDGHDGSYFYGVSKRPKEFILRCYFEDSAIDRGIMERIYSLFKTGKSGKLVFNRRPWCFYYATVTSLPHPELSNYLNGLITITMKASYPFARSDCMYSEPDDVQHELVMRSTAMVDQEEMVPQTSFSDISGRTSIILHNPGTERAPVSIMLSGDVGMGVTVRNNTTKQECKIVAMNSTHPGFDRYVYIDGINGNTITINEDGSEPASGFVYHDSGFIQLESAYPCIRKVFLEETRSSTVEVVNTIYDDVTGQYIYIDNQWCKILEQIDDHNLRLDRSVSTENSAGTIITRMNEIEIIPTDTINISRISFLYKPTFA